MQWHQAQETSPLKPEQFVVLVYGSTSIQYEKPGILVVTSYS